MSKPEDLSGSELEDDLYTSDGAPVFIALVDSPVKETDEISIEDTFIGGEPNWLHPTSIPDENLLRCGACKSRENMKLLLQAFSPLDYDLVEELQQKHGMNNMAYISPDDDRVLYVFICIKCQRKANSVRCIRGVKKNVSASSNSEKLSQKMASLSVGKDFQINPFDFSNGQSNPSNANPFQSTTSSNPFGQETNLTNNVNSGHATLAKDSEKKARKLHDLEKDKDYDSSKAFKNYLLYVEEETFKNKKPEHLKLPKNLKIENTALDLTAEVEADLHKDPIKLDPRTEKLSKFLDDDTFQKFQEIVAYNPLQVLRYDFGGHPLLYAESKIDFESKVPNPGYNPSSKRIFELQLMPKAILDLEENVSLVDGMEWGTILVFSDIENYTPKFDSNGVGYVEECVKVQWESRT